MASVLIGHPGLATGGSELKACWAVSALRPLYSVTVATGRPIDLPNLNRHCGTNLQPEDMEVLLAPRGPYQAIGHTDALRGALFTRFLRAVASRCDVCISAYNMLDFGKPAIQFIADFSFSDDLRLEFHPLARGYKGWFHRPGMLRDGYLALTRGLAGAGPYDGREDWLVANSEWTAGILRTRLGLPCHRVIYPPVAVVVEDLPWPQREIGFVSIGRVSPEKRLDRVIDILERVRAAGHDLHLHLIGAIGDDRYGRSLRERIARNATWCYAEGYRTGSEKMALLARHRFALHACVGEAFGVAVAEYVEAGCIPLVPHVGGAAEIVGMADLTFADEDEAVAKIVQLLRSPDRQRAVRAVLRQRKGLFSPERFVAQIRDLVADWRARQ